MSLNSLLEAINKNKTVWMTLGDVTLLIGSIVAGYLFANLLRTDNIGPEQAAVSATSIFIHNLILSLVVIALTYVVAYPVILFNGFFLGLNLNFGIEIYGIKNTFYLMVYHTPLELSGWLLTLNISRKIVTLYKKENPINQLKQIVIRIACLIVIYLVSALVEKSQMS